MLCCGFGQQIFVGHLETRFGKLQVWQSCLPMLPGCGVGWGCQQQLEQGVQQECA